MVSHCPFEFELLSLILKPFIIHANQSIQLSHQSPHTARLNYSHIRHHSLHTHFPACCCHQPGCCFRNAPPHGQLCSHLTVSSTSLSWVLSSEIPWQSLPGSGSPSHCFRGCGLVPGGLWALWGFAFLLVGSLLSTQSSFSRKFQLISEQAAALRMTLENTFISGVSKPV